MANFLLWMTVSFIFMRACIQAEVTFQNCGTPSDHVAELDLEKDSETELTCIGIGAEKDVRWALDRKTDSRPAGLCRPPSDGSDCNNYLAGTMTPSRTSASESTMRIHHGGEYQRSLENAALTCGEEEVSGSTAKCPIDLIKPADGTCKAEVDTTSDAWRVHVHCDVTSGNSTMNRYKCILRQNRNEIKKMKMTQNTLPAGSAVCDIWVRLNTSVTDGYNYEVQFIPGRKVVRVEGDITIERPNEPEITNCRPEGIVPENQTLTCDCGTDRTGKPEGHLRWSVKVAEKEKTFHILKDGEKGGKSLPLTTRPLTQSNHTNKLRCGVQWGNEFIRDSYSHEVQVGFPASRVEMNITPPNLEEGKELVSFECCAKDGRPSPEVELSRKGADRLKSSQTSLRHEIHARCEDSGEYTCRASNGMGPDQNVTNRLNVTCKPRDISGHIPPILYQDKEERFTFELVANPLPSKVTFGFLGSSGLNTTSEVKDIFLSGRCGRKGASLTRVTCNVVVSNVTSWKAGGVYRGSVVNEKGRLDFDFVVKLNATVVESSSNIGLVAGAAAGAVVAIAIIIVIAFVLIRRGSRETKAFLGNGDDRDEDHLARCRLVVTGHVYGNINMQNAENNQPQDAGALDADGGAEYNQDGLLYVSVDFANKGPTPRPAPPEEDGVLYSDINFNRTAPSE